MNALLYLKQANSKIKPPSAGLMISVCLSAIIVAVFVSYATHRVPRYLAGGVHGRVEIPQTVKTVIMSRGEKTKTVDFQLNNDASDRSRSTADFVLTHEIVSSYRRFLIDIQT